jgi:hypothetical protein
LEFLPKPVFRASIPAGNADKGENPLRLPLRQWESNGHYSLSTFVKGKSAGSKFPWLAHR